MKDRLHRIAFTRPVYVHVAGSAERAHRLLAGNLSRGGMFVRSGHALIPGTRVTVALEAKGQPRAFAEGEVVWAAPRESTTTDAALPGFGVRFVRFLHSRSEDLLDFLIHRQAAHLPPELANQQIGESGTDDAPDARPPRDFMNTPINDLAGSTHKNITDPQWAKSAEQDPPVPEQHEERDAGEGDAQTPDSEQSWFLQPDTHPASALDAADAGARVGAAVVLVTFLVVVAGGLLWLIKRDAAAPGAGAPTAQLDEAMESDDPFVEELDAPAHVTAPIPAHAKPPADPSTPRLRHDAQGERTRDAAPGAISPPSPAPAAASPAESTKTPSAVIAGMVKRTALASGAARSVSLSRSGKVATAQVELLSGASIDRVFVLSKPDRVVVDLNGPSPKGSAQSAVGAAGVETLRVGARAGGTRLVFDVTAPASSATVVDGAVRIQYR